jgi:hypothetical protein
MRSGAKNHEFRKYRLPPDAHYLWLYKTTPVHGIRTVIEGDSVLLPGQVVGPRRYNAEFNAGLLNAKFAYPIKRLFKLSRVSVLCPSVSSTSSCLILGDWDVRLETGSVTCYLLFFICLFPFLPFLTPLPSCLSP